VEKFLSRGHLFVLLAGDAVFLLAVTWLGFASHGRSLTGGRWLVTYLPLLGSWLAIAWLLGLFIPSRINLWQVVWRVFAAAVFSAPLAVLLRALWLQQTVIPVFGLVMIATTAAGMAIWRLAWAAWSNRKPVVHG